MSYKKLVSLLAVSALALGACATDDAEEPATDDTEQTEDTGAETEETTDTDDAEEADGEGSSTQDRIQQAKEQSGEAFPEYGLTVSGTWTVDGYEVEYAPGEAATIPVSVVSEAEGYNVYLLEDGAIAEVQSDTEAVEFVVENPSADTDYVVGITPDDLGEAGDEVDVDDFYRYENVVLVEAAAAEEAE